MPPTQLVAAVIIEESAHQLASNFKHSTLLPSHNVLTQLQNVPTIQLNPQTQTCLLNLYGSI